MKCKNLFSMFIYVLTLPNYGSGCCLYIFPNSHVVDKLKTSTLITEGSSRSSLLLATISSTNSLAIG